MSLEFTLVRRAISLAVIDGPDAGDNPDILKAQGSVLFEPVIKKGDSIQVQTRGGSQTYALAPIECPINDGIISHRGQDGVKLPAGGEAANPSLIRWKATFSRMQAGGKSFTLAPVIFDAVPGGEIDLTMVAPVAGAPEGVVRGPRGTSLESIIVDGSELVFTAVDDAGSFEIARIPLDEMVRAEAEAAADGVRDALAVDVAASQSARDAAEGHADRAATSESNAATSETNAKQSEDNAGDYAAVATTAATEAVDAMERATDLAGGDFATHQYVDDALVLKADKTYVDENKFNRGNIPAPSAGGDANLLDLLGAYNFTNASVPNTPSGIGTILNLPIGSAKTQLFVNWNTPALYIRRQSTSGSWTGWVKFASMSDLANLATKSELANFATKDELAAIGGSSPRSVSGTKIVPLSITAPGTTKLEPAASGAVRWVRKWAHMPKRVRVHISNWHPANNQGGGGSIAIYGRLGAADEQGNFRRSSLIFSSKVIPGNKTELVSPWVTVGANEGEHLGLTIGWTGMPGDMYMMQGGGWRKDTNSGWSAHSLDETWEWAQETPFYVWIEAEVPASTPVVMVNGDSISIGTASSNPVTDGWASVYAREQNALPVLFSQHGSSMTSWTTTGNRWNNLYPGVDVQPDAIISALGQNDLAGTGMNLETLQTRYEAVRQSYLDRWPEVPVYIAGVTPSTKSSAVEVIRRDFNTWLATYPFGERGYFDFSAAVGSADDETLAPEYSADGLHPNTAGQQVLGELVASHPVTPYVATEQQLKTLKAVGEHE